jgi:predicted GIY-YIG superfamily endonuclease
MAWHVYVLENPSGLRYVGFTGRAPEQRLEEHNHGLNRWTKAHRPWRLVYSEAHHVKADAQRRERYFKTGVGREERDMLVGASQWVKSAAAERLRS